MTWTKLGDEFLPAAAELTDAEYRTHVEALIWSSWRLLDLQLPKADVRRFAESPDAAAAITGLVTKGWWEDRGNIWYIGLRWPEWQQTRDVVTKRKVYLTDAKRRSRAHQKGDHSLCRAACGKSTDASTVDPGRDGSVFSAPQGAEKNSVPASTVDRSGARRRRKADDKPTPAAPSVDEITHGARCGHGELAGRCALCRYEIPADADEPLRRTS